MILVILQVFACECWCSCMCTYMPVSVCVCLRICPCLFLYVCDDSNVFLTSLQLLNRITHNIRCIDYDYELHSVIFISASLTVPSEVLLYHYYH